MMFKWAPESNIDQGGPGPFNVIFTNHFKWGPNNNIDPEGPRPQYNVCQPI